MNPGITTEEIAKAVAEAHHFSVALFRGVGKYDRGNCDSLEAARDMGRRMVEAAGSLKLPLVYAVSASGGSVLVPRDFQAS